MNYVLPRKDCYPLNFMMAMLSGMKSGLKNISDDNGIQFRQHFESLKLLESRASDWLDYLQVFRNWDKYVPNIYVKRIKR